MLDSLWKDLRFGARQLRMNPGFTAVAVLSLALGIGANTAIFQLVDAVRLRTLPVTAPEDLVYIDFAEGAMRSGNFSTRNPTFTYRQWQQLQTHSEPFSGMVAWAGGRFNLASGGEARYAEGMFVSGDFFRVLGVPALIGRTIGAQDDQPGCASPVAMVSYAFWQRELGGDPNVLTRTLVLDRKTLPVIGVTGPNFFGVEVGRQFDVAVPLCADRYLAGDGRGRIDNPSAWWLGALGRLKPGWTIERAGVYLRTQSPRIMETTLPPTYRPDGAKRYLANQLELSSGATGVSSLRRQYNSALLLLLGITGLVLLIGCANLANLLLARASVREREIAVRQAIGASRGRLIRQLLVESLLLSVLGTALGTLLAQFLSKALVAFLTTKGNPIFVGLGIDWRVLGFTSGVALLACLLFGLLPSIRATRVTLTSAMRAGGRGLTADRERFSARRTLMVAQVALSLVLLVGALLFIGSLQKLMHVDPGFRVDGLLMVDLTWTGTIPRERYIAMSRDVEDRLRAIPGVAGASEVAITPISGSQWNSMVWADGTNDKHQESFFNRVGVGYFATTGTALLAGREFNQRDVFGAATVAIVNEAFVKRFFGEGTNPVGRRFRVEGQAGKADPLYEVVGVVRNTKYYEVREDFLPIAYLAFAQDDDPGGGPTFLVRTMVPPGEVVSAAKSLLSANQPDTRLVFHVIRRQIDDSLLRDRLMANLAGAFGLLAAVLATLGLYGVIAYMVARRQNEIGVRVALGADRGSVIRLVLREALVLLGIGLAVGAGLAIWAGRVVATLVFGMKPGDPVVLGGAITLLAVVALLASYVPALRAARVQPMQALRME